MIQTNFNDSQVLTLLLAAFLFSCFVLIATLATFRRYFKGIFAVMLLLAWPATVVYAFLEAITVQFHEASHALAAISFWFTARLLIATRIKTRSRAFSSGACPVTRIVIAKNSGKTCIERFPSNMFVLGIIILAGYAGSTFVGCFLIVCSFDIRASKVALLFNWSLIAGMLLLCTFKLCMLACGYGDDHEAYGSIETECEDGKGGTKRESRKTCWLVIGISTVMLCILTCAWAFSDSVALRPVVLALGVFFAFYSLWNIAQDCIFSSKNNREKSDCGKMYTHVWKRISARWWGILLLSLAVGLVTASFFAGLKFFPQDLEEQRISSRKWLPVAPNHWRSVQTFNTLSRTPKLFGFDVKKKVTRR